MRDNTTVDNVLGEEIAVDVDESEAVDMVLAPGDVEVHHPNIVHGSTANTSPLSALRADHPLHPDLDPDHDRRAAVPERVPPARRARA